MATEGAPRVLVLEDEPEWGRFLENELREVGCEALWCAHSCDAERWLHEQQFDVVIIDVHLADGDIDGVQFVKTARRAQTVSTVGISGVPGSPWVDLMRQVADRFLDKPVQRAELVEAVVSGARDARDTFHRELQLEARARTAARDHLSQGLAGAVLSEVAPLEVVPPVYRFRPVGVVRWSELPSSATGDPNVREFLRLIDRLVEEHPGEYAAFVDGKLVDVDPDEEHLKARIASLAEVESAMIQRIEETVAVTRLSRPFRRLR